MTKITKDEFKVTLTPLYLYQQYQTNELLVDVFREVGNFIQETYIDGILKTITQGIAFRQEAFVNELFAFYATNIFGARPPLSGEAVSQFYDTNLEYDGEISFDSLLENQGSVDLTTFKTMLEIMVDYNIENFNLEWFVELPSKWGGSHPNEVIPVLGEDSLTIWIPGSSQNANFVKLFVVLSKNMDLPFGFNIDYKIGVPPTPKK